MKLTRRPSLNGHLAGDVLPHRLAASWNFIRWTCTTCCLLLLLSSTAHAASDDITSSAATSGELSLSDEPSSAANAPLKLPEHPTRRAAEAKATTPTASRPNRDSHRTVPTRMVRTGKQMPIPGRPARRLPSLIELKEAEAARAAARREKMVRPQAESDDKESLDDAEAEEEEEAEEEDEEVECEEPPGLILRLPHSLACDAITGEY
ncbi:MAG: hypothetical protein KDB23_17280, partial [Planctomycetales bacterium]|nr:hypothetical protein [Planctomycetales bacterium]